MQQQDFNQVYPYDGLCSAISLIFSVLYSPKLHLKRSKKVGTKKKKEGHNWVSQNEF